MTVRVRPLGRQCRCDVMGEQALEGEEGIQSFRNASTGSTRAARAAG